jgi:hypothetical protein
MVNSIALLILLSSVNAQQVRGLANAETDERRSLIETYEQAGGSEYTTTRQPVTRKLDERRSLGILSNFFPGPPRKSTRRPSRPSRLPSTRPPRKPTTSTRRSGYFDKRSKDRQDYINNRWEDYENNKDKDDDI